MDHNKLWKILQEMGIPEHFTCLLRNLYARQEAMVTTKHGTMDWVKLGKEYVKAVREGNGTPLQYSCLENPMGGGA